MRRTAHRAGAKAFDIAGVIAITARSPTAAADHSQLMTKRVQAKNKICRRLGVNLWGRAKNPIVKRDYPPGEHGTKRRKASDYGTQLAAKQKLKGYYGNITERQFHRLYQ